MHRYGPLLLSASLRVCGSSPSAQAPAPVAHATVTVEPTVVADVGVVPAVVAQPVVNVVVDAAVMVPPPVAPVLVADPVVDAGVVAAEPSVATETTVSASDASVETTIAVALPAAKHGGKVVRAGKNVVEIVSAPAKHKMEVYWMTPEGESIPPTEVALATATVRVDGAPHIVVPTLESDHFVVPVTAPVGASVALSMPSVVVRGAPVGYVVFEPVVVAPVVVVPVATATVHTTVHTTVIQPAVVITPPVIILEGHGHGRGHGRGHWK